MIESESYYVNTFKRGRIKKSKVGWIRLGGTVWIYFYFCFIQSKTCGENNVWRSKWPSSVRWGFLCMLNMWRNSRWKRSPVRWASPCPRRWGPSQAAQCLHALLLLLSWYCHPGGISDFFLTNCLALFLATMFEVQILQEKKNSNRERENQNEEQQQYK